MPTVGSIFVLLGAALIFLPASVFFAYSLYDDLRDREYGFVVLDAFMLGILFLIAGFICFAISDHNQKQIQQTTVETNNG